MTKYSLVALLLLTFLSVSQSIQLDLQCLSCIRNNTKCPRSCCIPKWNRCSRKLRCCGGLKCKRTRFGPRCAPIKPAQPKCAEEGKYCSRIRKCCDALECKYVKVDWKINAWRCEAPDLISQPSASQDIQDCETCKRNGTICPFGC